MKFSDLQPIVYELLRVEVDGEVLCDIRLEKRWPSERWRIVDGINELSCVGKWAYELQKPKNLNYYRFDTPEEALEVWNRGVELPHVMQGAEHHLGRIMGEARDCYEAAYNRIRVACGGEVKP
ncbi:hypothetical protein IAD21_00918 [Abditibacteriota bacterium]|nr:hypothetical protein IAD21_00918 [Abditibacteriota bacterium]